MARWRLRAKHYLNVEGVDWEYKETMQNGKQKRMTLPVPMFLDPDDASEHTPMGSGEIVVALSGYAHQKNDLIFTGQPTPDMEPLDEEAEEISASYRDSWKHPIESLEGNYGETIANDLAAQLTKAIQAAGGLASPQTDEVAKLRETLAQQGELIAKLMASQEAKPERRI